MAFGFLLVCLLNTIGLLLAKFLRRSSEIGVRRALGPRAGRSSRSSWSSRDRRSGRRRPGAGLAWLGLWAVRQQPSDYAALAELDLPMLATTFALAITSSVLAGLVPAWRACQIPPALQLKSQ